MGTARIQGLPGTEWGGGCSGIRGTMVAPIVNARETHSEGEFYV